MFGKRPERVYERVQWQAMKDREMIQELEQNKRQESTVAVQAAL